jgi:ribonucleoside-diphosphate reductase alpha chain
MYEDGKPGEIFLVMAKEGSVVSGLMDSFATAVSLALQYGVPLNVLVDKFSHVRFEPSGFTNNPEIPIAKSIIDYIFRYLGAKFFGREAAEANGVHVRAGAGEAASKDGSAAGALRPAPPIPVTFVPGPSGTGSGTGEGSHAPFAFRPDEDAPPCPDCGSIMVRNGACYKCMNCGATSGCS